jgi:hypothetical protein
MTLEISPSDMLFDVSKYPFCKIEKMDYTMANRSRCVQHLQKFVVFHEIGKMRYCP